MIYNLNQVRLFKGLILSFELVEIYIEWTIPILMLIKRNHQQSDRSTLGIELID